METEPKEVSAKEAETAGSSEGEATKPPEAASATGAETVQADPAKPADAGSAAVAESDAASGNGAALDQSQHQTIYRLLDEALDAAPPPRVDEGGRAYKHPLFVDFLLAIGLLVAMGGFTIGLMKLYITHSAEVSIQQHNYKAAIAVLKDAPLPGFFQIYGKDPRELLNRALYLEATDRLDANSEDPAALRELAQITPGSYFFDMAQDQIREHTHPSKVQLNGRTEHEASPDDRPVDEPVRIPPDNSADDGTSSK
ncbi:MAG TPA: hypothetical protein V6C81_17960 [Planktothrix sp.]